MLVLVLALALAFVGISAGVIVGFSAIVSRSGTGDGSSGGSDGCYLCGGGGCGAWWLWGVSINCPFMLVLASVGVSICWRYVALPRLLAVARSLSGVVVAAVVVVLEAVVAIAVVVAVAVGR